MTNRQKILYFVTEDWYFCSHRMALAVAAQQAGYDVSVLTRVDQDGELIRQAGMNLIELDVMRGSINPIYELNTLWNVWKVYRQLQPDIVHHVALKPVLYGSLVAMFFPRLKVVNLMAGLGAIFSSRNWKAFALKPWIKLLFSVLFRQSHSLTIVQNREDYDLLSRHLRVPVARLRLIKGSGVDIQQFYPKPEPIGLVNIALVSRLLWDKGIGEYVAAVRLLKQKGLVFNAYLVGKPDAENMASISTEQLQLWQTEGYVHCLGYVEAVAQFWHKTHIAVLPSYREGLPKSLLEAAACGRPIITTNTSGCKEIVDDGINGILVPVKAVNELADAMEKLILNQDLREKMGAAGRLKLEQEFSDAIILSQTIGLYREIL